jgi:hypothetical protein
MKVKMKSKKLKDRLKAPTVLRKAAKSFNKSSDDDKPSWMITSREAREEANEQAKSMSMRVPELWIADGDERMLRFRDEDAIASLWRYTVNLGGGKFMQFTAPAEGEVDLFRDQLGLSPQLRTIYEVIDRTGYVDKKTGKTKKNIPRFLNANGKQTRSLETIHRKRGPLCNYDITCNREGSGQQTTYTYMHENPSPMPKEFKILPRLKDDFEKYYAPPTEAQQRALVSRIGRVLTDED